MVQPSASSLSPSPRTQSLINQAMAAICTQVRGLAELLAFFVAGAVAIWALFFRLGAGARVRSEAGSPITERLAPFPTDD